MSARGGMLHPGIHRGMLRSNERYPRVTPRKPFWCYPLDAKVQNGYRVVGIKAECLCSPLFLQEAGSLYCWLNPQLNVSSTSNAGSNGGGPQGSTRGGGGPNGVKGFNDDDDDDDLSLYRAPKPPAGGSTPLR